MQDVQGCFDDDGASEKNILRSTYFTNAETHECMTYGMSFGGYLIIQSDWMTYGMSFGGYLLIQSHTVEEEKASMHCRIGTLSVFNAQPGALLVLRPSSCYNTNIQHSR